MTVTIPPVVRGKGRLIHGLLAPVEEISAWRGGERWSRGAFALIEYRVRHGLAVPVTWTHDEARVCGRVVTIREADEGAEVAAWIDSSTWDGVLALEAIGRGRAGLSPHWHTGGESTGPQGERVIEHVDRLHHVAITPDPAYERARIYDQRAAATGRPPVWQAPSPGRGRIETSAVFVTDLRLT